ncbi:MAG: hypothetical protein IJ697_08695 [Synergistaceae bacterium]|nr:hypothetical protein [Synergistaceae bacterium]
MTNNLFVVVSKKLYYYSVEEGCICPTKSTFCWRLIRKLIDLLKLPYPQIILNQEIKKCSGKLVISDSAFGGNVRLLRALRKVTNRTDQVLYYMNIVDNVNIEFMKHFEECATFDEKDSKKYAMRHTIFPYTDYYSNNFNDNHELKYDLIFLGRAKDRLEELLKIKYKADEANLVTRFMVLDTDNPDIGINKYIDYQDYMKMVLETRCLVEILQNGQEGSSLRVKEALFLHKKLITNNRAIVDEWFYDKNNMYVLGVDGRSMKSFVRGEYVENNINLDNLDFSYWIDSF